MLFWLNSHYWIILEEVTIGKDNMGLEKGNEKVVGVGATVGEEKKGS